MKTYLRNLWESVGQSLWLMPAVAIAFALGASFLMLRWEAALGADLSEIPLMYRSGRDASLAIVGTIVGSLMTVAGVTFSITIVSLTLASSQFGPRLLRNFLRSRPSQITLGALVGSFVYGILIMTGMDSDWQSGEAHPSVTLMIALACACVCLIVYYIHHVATSIQADELVASVYREIELEIDSLEERDDGASGQSVTSPEWGDPNVSFEAPRSGYLTAVNCEGLSDWAGKGEGKVELLRRPGQFVMRGESLARGFGVKDEESFRKALRESIFLRDKRTPEQDLEFLVDQLVEVALRAISPGINDPNTAIVCIDYLAAALFQLKDKQLPPRFIACKDGEARVYVPRTDFEGLVNSAFEQLRQSGAKYPEIVIRLLHSLCRLSASLDLHDPRQESLVIQFEAIEEIFQKDKSLAETDKKDIEQRLERFRELRER